MKKSELRNIIKEELIEASIRDDAKLFLDDLIKKGIIKSGYVTSTSFSGPKGKNQLFVRTDGDSYNNLKNKIEKNYKKTGVTSLSSPVYYSSV